MNYQRRRRVGFGDGRLPCLAIGMGLAGIITCAFDATAQRTDAQPPSLQQEESEVTAKRYDGATIDEWLGRIRRLDPKSPFNAWAVPGLIAIVEDDELPDEVRRQAAMTLGRMGATARAAVPVLQKLLDPATSAYDWAAGALPFFAHEARSATPALVAILENERLPARKRIATLEGLARIGSSHPDAVPALGRMLHYRPSPDAAISAADAVVLRELAADALAFVGPSAEVAVPLLMRTVRDPRESESVRRKAIRALGAIGPGAAIALPAIAEALEFDDSAAARDAAAEALVALGDSALPIAQRYLQHPDSSVRWRIAAALGKVPADQWPIARPLLLEGLEDPEPLVRIAAAESLHKLESNPRPIALHAIPLLGSDDRQIRMRAFRLIPQLAPLSAEEQKLLEQLRQDPGAIVRRMAEKIGGNE